MTYLTQCSGQSEVMKEHFAVVLVCNSGGKRQKYPQSVKWGVPVVVGSVLRCINRPKQIYPGQKNVT
jgi:hypothetical protein